MINYNLYNNNNKKKQKHIWKQIKNKQKKINNKII